MKNIQLLKFDTLQSTNVTAVDLAKNGAAEGTVIVAETQEGGRGRMKRVWNSPKGGLWFSIILRPQIDPQYAAQITLLTGVTVAKALRKLYETEKVMIKWPNDLLLDGKKICGILSEMQLDENGNVDYAVVGVGINVALAKDAFPRELQDVATSLNESLNKKYTCDQVLDQVLSELKELYDKWLCRGAKVILEPWRVLNCTLDKKVHVKDNDEVIFSGTVIGINEYGAIVVDDGNGNTQVYDFGEISLR